MVNHASATQSSRAGWRYREGNSSFSGPTPQSLGVCAAFFCDQARSNWDSVTSATQFHCPKLYTLGCPSNFFLYERQGGGGPSKFFGNTDLKKLRKLRTTPYFVSFSKSPCMCHIAHRCIKPASRDHFSAKIAFIYTKKWSFWTGLLYFTFSIGPNQPLMAIVLAYDCTAWRGVLPWLLRHTHRLGGEGANRTRPRPNQQGGVIHNYSNFTTFPCVKISMASDRGAFGLV